jgi:hypothetical protein
MRLDQKHGFFPCKFADFRFSDWDSKEIFGLIITGSNLRICDLRTGTPKKLRVCDCGLSPRICGFATNKQNLRAHLCILDNKNAEFAISHLGTYLHKLLLRIFIYVIYFIFP